MYEIEIMNKTNNDERTIIFGYSVKNAFERAKLNSNDWIVLIVDYVD